MQTRLFSLLVLAIWLGTYTFRSYVPAAVWNLSDELPFQWKPVFALATHVIGMLGVVIVWKWRRRTLVPLAIAFAAVTVTRQVFIATDAIGPWLALLSWPLWLWFMAALADETAAHDAETLLAPAFATAIALQLGMQSAWHGIDLASARGSLAVAIVATLAVLLALNAARLPVPTLPRPHTSLAWLLLGPALFLELTFIGNVGRVSEMSGLSLPTTVVTQQISLLLGVILAFRFTQLWQRVVAITLGFIAVFAYGLSGPAALIALAVQIVVIAGLREAASRRVRVSAATAFTIGALVFFALIFAFYNAYELPPLWILAYAPLAAAAGMAQRAGEWPPPRVVTWLAASCGLTILYLIPPPPSQRRDENVMTVMTYNIHHGFNDDGVPGMQHTATEIANARADLIALQEIGRGWTLLGGNDLIGYLRWRFPEYVVSYTPINGKLWGLATMSRAEVVETDGKPFDAAPGAVRYGWSAVTVTVRETLLRFYSVHVTPDLVGPMGDARLEQIQVLQNRARGRLPVIVAGDFNAHPEDPPMVSMRAAFRDLGEDAGLGNRATWPAARANERIDYVFGQGVTATSAFIPQTTASDHLPVIVRVRFDDTTSVR